MPYTSKDAKQSNRLRHWLRKHTHYRNTNEFFTAILFETGAPPHPITQQIANNEFQSFPQTSKSWYMWMNNKDWRDRVAGVMSARTHHSIDPSYAVQEYLKWLYQKQESGAISVR